MLDMYGYRFFIIMFEGWSVLLLGDIDCTIVYSPKVTTVCFVENIHFPSSHSVCINV